MTLHNLVSKKEATQLRHAGSDPFKARKYLIGTKFDNHYMKFKIENYFDIGDK